MTPLERFWSYVDKSEGCWLWKGAVSKGGYAYLSDGSKLKHRVRAHRFSWELHFGPIPADKEVCHNCDADYPPGDITYRRCVRPDHLFLGTHQENMADMVAKGRNGKRPRVIPEGASLSSV